MTGRIVVGIDGSPQSGRALDWAVARARLGGQRLELVHTYTMATEFDFYGYHGLAAGHPLDWMIELSQELLDAAAAHVREVAPEVTCTVESRMGTPAQVLAEASEGADAVVIGRRGLGGAASVLLGSVGNRLTTHARCPVVVVGDGELPTSGPVVVGVDDSEFGTHALRFAIAEAAVRRTNVRAVTAYDEPPAATGADPELLARMQAEAEAEAADTVTRALEQIQGADAHQPGVDRVAVEGRAAEAILAHADDAQLIVVGSHGKGVVRRVLLGSVSRQVLHDADRPVAVVDLVDD